jgi:glycerophosphoryl diester phosphodiesterase
MALQSGRRPLLLGHRGCRLKKFCENSTAAFEHSLDVGCDGFEFDVRLTSDRKLICVHDETIKRCDVGSADYEQLCKLYLKSWIGPERTALATLPEVVKRFAGRAFLDIELKVAGIEEPVADLLRGADPERYVVSSFLPQVIRRMAEIDSTIPLGYISRRLDALRAWPNLPGKYVIPRHDLVSHELITAVHEAGRKLLTWTVNSPKEMRALAEWGVDGIISDDPKLLSETLGFGR